MKKSPNGCSAALTARLSTLFLRTFRNARTIRILPRLRLRALFRKAHHYSRATLKSRFRFRKSRRPGLKFRRMLSLSQWERASGESAPRTATVDDDAIHNSAPQNGLNLV